LEELAVMGVSPVGCPSGGAFVFDFSHVRGFY
jgi:hypothetical protein